MRRVAIVITLAAALTAVVAIAGCEKLMQNMYDQPKYEPLEASSLFADGRASRPLIPGTVAQSSGALADASSGGIGASIIIGAEHGPLLPLDARGLVQARLPARRNSIARRRKPTTLRTLRRGQERFNVYCSPCHGRAGDGNGMIVQRGFPRPPSLHTEALRLAPIDHFYGVITHGYGVMYSYADRVPPRDRWAIAAYIRALQLSRHATLDDIPKARREMLEVEQP